MAFPAFFDACTLYGVTLTDLLLRLADAGAFRPLWSEDVLMEAQRNVIERIGDDERVRRRFEVMRLFFPDADVTGYHDLIESLDCDPKDRHVLAAAIRANADVLVTFNLSDFPDESLAPFDVEAVHPDDFLLDQLDLVPGIVLTVLAEMVSDYDNPPQTVDDVLESLRRSGVPRFTEDLRRYL